MRRLTLRLLGVSLFGSNIDAHEADVTDAVAALGALFKCRQLHLVTGYATRQLPDRCRCRRGSTDRWASTPTYTRGPGTGRVHMSDFNNEAHTKKGDLNEYNTNTSKQDYPGLNTIESKWEE